MDKKPDAFNAFLDEWAASMQQTYSKLNLEENFSQPKNPFAPDIPTNSTPISIAFMNENTNYDNKLLNCLKFFTFLFIAITPIIVIISKHNQLIGDVIAHITQ